MHAYARKAWLPEFAALEAMKNMALKNNLKVHLKWISEC